MDFPTVVMMEFSHACQIVKNSEITRKHFCDQKYKFPRLSQIFHGPRKSEKFQKILKIIQKFPRLLERAENAKNVWENLENRGKILE